jgi:hypothetical protein
VRRWIDNAVGVDWFWRRWFESLKWGIWVREMLGEGWWWWWWCCSWSLLLLKNVVDCEACVRMQMLEAECEMPVLGNAAAAAGGGDGDGCIEVDTAIAIGNG